MDAGALHDHATTLLRGSGEGTLRDDRAAAHDSILRPGPEWYQELPVQLPWIPRRRIRPERKDENLCLWEQLRVRHWPEFRRNVALPARKAICRAIRLWYSRRQPHELRPGR